jgi:hypothetical protein
MNPKAEFDFQFVSRILKMYKGDVVKTARHIGIKQALVEKIVTDGAKDHVSKVLDKVFENLRPATAEDLLKAHLRIQGLELLPNGDITNESGKVVAIYKGDARFENNELKYTVKLLQAINFISIDVKVDA